MRRFVSRFSYSCTLIGNSPQSLTGHIVKRHTDQKTNDMNIPVLIANLLTLLAFFIHTFIGNRELRIIEPESNNDEKYLKREKWIMV